MRRDFKQALFKGIMLIGTNSDMAFDGSPQMSPTD